MPNKTAIISSGNGSIVFDADVMGVIHKGSMSHEDRIRLTNRLLDPTGKRSRYFKELNETHKNKQPNFANPEVSKARKQFEEVMTYNTKLLERGLNPNNPDDMKHFKKLDPSLIAKAMVNI